MTFRDVAIKNFKVNTRKFFSYFLCSSFSIMIFFIYTTLLFNDDLRKKPDYDMISLLFYISLTALTTFSIFFINYAHSAFMKSRNKEFGVYLTLGMNTDDLGRLVNLENLIIIIASLIAGLISGLLFSRLFQMVILKLLNIEGVRYSLNYKSFALTSAVFAVIFIIVIILSSIEAKKLDISDLIKESRRGEGKAGSGIVPGLMGIGILLLSLVMVVIIAHNEKLRSNTAIVVMYIILSFVGAYMTISYIGAAIMNFIKDSDYYYRNILSLTEIMHKFNQNKRVIFILSILSAMTITLVASPFALYGIAGNIAERNSNHIEFAQLGNINRLSEDELKAINGKADTPVKGISSIEFISLGFEGERDKEDVLGAKPVISQDVYNSVTGLHVQLNKGEAINVITSWMPGNHGIEPSSTIKLSDGSRVFEFTIKDSNHSKWVSAAEIYKSCSGLVVSNEDYNNLKSAVNAGNIGFFEGVKFENWRKTGAAVDALIDKLNRNNKGLAGSEKKVSPLFQVTASVKRYEDLKKAYSFFIFVTSVMGILFFIAGGSVLFFKKYSELNSDKERFFKLYKIGISEKEAVNVIAGELRVVFFSPLAVGSLLGCSYIYLLTFLFSGGDLIKEFMSKAAWVVIAYFLFQAGFYYITKRKYTGEVLGNR